MRNATFFAFIPVLLIVHLLVQADQVEQFSFKDDKLGMSLEDFKAKHVIPGSWENEGTKIISGGDFHHPPRGKGRWKWKSYLVCKDNEPSKGVIVRCEYDATLAGIPSVQAQVAAVFVEDKLAAVTVSYTNHSPLIPQALVDKLGPPVRLPVAGRSNRNLSALRWDNGISVVEFQENYCGSQDWSKDVTEILRDIFCDNDDGGGGGPATIWYVHKSLANLVMTRSREFTESVKKRAASEQFSFDDKLGMSFEDFKVKRKSEAANAGWTPEKACTKTGTTISECQYSMKILGFAPYARAIFVDNKLAVVHLFYPYADNQSVVVSGVRVSVNISRALIDRFGTPEVIRGLGDSALTGDDRRALHWDDAVFIVEYQQADCQGENQYERIARILEKHYCEHPGFVDNSTSNIWYVHKALASLLMTRWKEAEENARKKARSEM
jgi:hypothetical protein